jgi:hypothetical protein
MSNCKEAARVKPFVFRFESRLGVWNITTKFMKSELPPINPVATVNATEFCRNHPCLVPVNTQSEILVRSRKPGSLRAMPSHFETSCAIAAKLERTAFSIRIETAPHTNRTIENFHI